MKIITYIHKGKVKNVSVDDLKMMKVQLTKAWEDACMNCGKCCFEKMMKNNVWIINYDKPCENLKFVSRKSMCNVYEKRFAKCEKCHTVPEAIQKRFLPSSCPYVRNTPAYKAPMDDGQWYKASRQKLSSQYKWEDDSSSTYAGTPTGGTSNLPAEPPYKATGAPTREDLAKPKEWKRRRQELLNRKRKLQEASQGKAGTSDPRQKTAYNIKPSGHALGG